MVTNNTTELVQISHNEACMSPRPSFFSHLHPPTLPAREARFRHTFGLGGIALFVFLVLCLTGALELFYYEPSLTGANASLQTLTFLVPLGGLVRGLHYWAAQLLVATVGLHLLRVMLTGAYKLPRRFNWLLGLGLLVGVLLLDFTGYALRWDTHISWALLVGTNLLKTIPVVGPVLYGMVVGGPELGASSLIRLYAWHIFGLAVPVFIVIAWHLFRVRRDGGIAHPSATAGEPAPARLTRAELVQREGLAALVVSAGLVLLAAAAPPALGPAADFAALPVRPTAPWFFIWVQELLRLGEPVVWGVLVPAGILAVLALWPYIVDRRPDGAGQWFSRHGRATQWLALGLAAILVGLTLRGALR
jgi:quinol-cytochrome oxidoreductase complex cytochrome b subunit